MEAVHLTVPVPAGDLVIILVIVVVVAHVEVFYVEVYAGTIAMLDVI